MISEHLELLKGHISVVADIFHCLAGRKAAKGKWEVERFCVAIAPFPDCGWAWSWASGLIAPAHG